ncbi:alkene reductase [Roseateles sp. L2-2]|uniref:alkene reductase n=1 Tax=Roseateles sp. L2-2 TaxID=3422597 RepID=UPI003D35EECD
MKNVHPYGDSPLFQPLVLGDLRLQNRIVMSPMSRNRARADDLPTALMATYYAQRASAGLIISESAQVSPQGKGYRNSPGIYAADQVAAWKTVVDGVHAAGGVMFLQLWHAGRSSHPDLQPDGGMPVGPSAIRPAVEVFTDAGLKAAPTPRALELREIPVVIEQYRQAARNALAAGFDGVEIHAGNGFLLDQFLRDGANRRQDAYGGSIANRTRLLLEIVSAVGTIWPSHRVGVRVSPAATYGDIVDSDPGALYGHLVRELNRFQLAYLHITEGELLSTRESPGMDFSALREAFDGVVISNNCYGFQDAEEVVRSGAVGMVSFGRPYIANPDLVERFRRGAALSDFDPSTLHDGGARGYTDYPPIDQPHTVSPQIDMADNG